MKESKDFLRVEELYRAMGLTYAGPPRMLEGQDKMQRIEMMNEELTEFYDAANIHDQYDAILDLIVFAFGTIGQMGLPFREGYDIVMDCNMAKRKGKTKRGHDQDLAKPEGWVGPEDKLIDLIDQVYERGGPEVSDPLLTAEKGSGCLKWDTDKPPIQLVPAEFIVAVANVLGYGAEKYGPNNWRQDGNGFPPVTRVFGSIMRHLLAFVQGQDLDAESRMSHLAHAATQIAILMYYLEYDMTEDDRCSHS